MNSFHLSSFTRSRSSRSFIPIPITSSQAQILPSKETARVNVFHTFGRLITNQVHGVQTGGSSKSKNVQLLTQCITQRCKKVLCDLRCLNVLVRTETNRSQRKHRRSACSLFRTTNLQLSLLVPASESLLRKCPVGFM